MSIATLIETYTWSIFMDACLEMFTTEYYFEKYPLLYEYSYTNFYDILKGVVDKAVSQGMSYQQCLNDIIDVVLKGARYSAEYIDDLEKEIKYILNQGAVFPEEKLFNREYGEEDTLEEEVYNYNVRGLLIDRFSDYIQCSKYADWSLYEDAYWEDLPEKNTEINRLRCLKYYSLHLQKTSS